MLGAQHTPETGPAVSAGDVGHGEDAGEATISPHRCVRPASSLASSLEAVFHSALCPLQGWDSGLATGDARGDSAGSSTVPRRPLAEEGTCHRGLGWATSACGGHSGLRGGPKEGWAQGYTPASQHRRGRPVTPLSRGCPRDPLWPRRGARRPSHICPLWGRAFPAAQPSFRPPSSHSSLGILS